MQRDREQVPLLMSSVIGLRGRMSFKTGEPAGSILTSWALDLAAGLLIGVVMLLEVVFSILEVLTKPSQPAELPKQRNAPALPFHEWNLEDTDRDV